MLGLMKEIMPYVQFANKDYGRDEEASRKAGRHIPRNATFIIITSHGSKDSSDHLVEEWLPRKRLEASRGAYNLEWVEKIEKAYEAWKKGHEVPREGTPILHWQMVSPEQNTRLRALGITTVEDLAAIPDSGLAEVGLDARVLRDLARNWIMEGEQKGINAQELANAQQKLRDQEGMIQQLKARLTALEAAQDKPRRGRPPKDEQSDEAA